MIGSDKSIPSVELECKTHFNKLTISDPSYDEGVWCRYSNTFEHSNWDTKVMVVDKHYEDGDGEFDYVVFGVLFTTDSLTDLTDLIDLNTAVNNEVVKWHPRLKLKNKFEIGMDTACFSIYAGNDNFDEIGTGTDGLLGNVYEFNFAGAPDDSKSVLAVLFLGTIDPVFIDTKQEFAERLVASCNAQFLDNATEMEL